MRERKNEQNFKNNNGVININYIYIYSCVCVYIYKKFKKADGAKHFTVYANDLEMYFQYNYMYNGIKRCHFH